MAFMTDGTAELLHTERIELRPITPTVAAALRAGGDGGLTWLDGGPFEGTLDACGGLLKAHEAGLYEEAWGAFAIVVTAEGVAVGGVGFHGAPRGGSCEIGYDLVPGARGRGLATEAARLVTAYALTHPGVEYVVAHTEPENVASQAVLSRAGFARDGETEGLFRFIRR
ncbi:Protein N-acetyltransferase, RimJ/RimL family [Streptacidiphilus jiangxiensis]|uniref:Protein N-acetyltransferase, RimJ/RimL family n=2 Tax=Streptacidiphilus jiangxiensis TaxID=235985 RepID=A0A1H7JHK8_STRJI|nr:Protein N-acetyltransferase, RimJ/RimL family [Streptacidiphilus jiangxiensis]